MKIAVLGTGAYGLALSLMLAKKEKNQITMWSENKKIVEEYKKTKKLSSILDVSIPNSINVTNSYSEALNDANIIFIVCAAKYVRSVCENIKALYKKNTPICIASKGIEESSQMFLSNVVKEILKTSTIVNVSGPTFAIDLANNEPCALAISGNNKRVLKHVKNALQGDTLKLRETKDIIGIQICGSVKNIIAIAAGILKGLGYSESTQAFLINESLHDIKYLIKNLGGNPKTILSFAGVGDLLLTCSSTKSRNFSFGYVVGNAKSKDEIVSYLKNNTVEGYYTLESINKLLKSNNITLPLIDIIYDIVMNGKDATTLAEFLIKKD